MSYIKRHIEDVYDDYVQGVPVDELCKKYQVTVEMVNEIVAIMTGERLV